MSDSVCAIKLPRCHQRPVTAGRAHSVDRAPPFGEVVRAAQMVITSSLQRTTEDKASMSSSASSLPRQVQTGTDLVPAHGRFVGRSSRPILALPQLLDLE